MKALRYFLSGVWIIAALSWLIRKMPLRFSHGIVCGVLRFGLIFLPRYIRIADTNLKLAFPDSSSEWRGEVIRGSVQSLAGLLIDFFRMPDLNREWANSHVDNSELETLRAMKQRAAPKGILVATGHLGSFELLAHAVLLGGIPVHFVMRRFGWRALNDWWTKSREQFGNHAIDREGAFKSSLAALETGALVALLFDQNVTSNHAVFVPWFGKLAATTKTLGLLALRHQIPVAVVGILSLPDDKYRILVEECDFAKLYADESLSSAEKIRQITAELSTRYEGMIRKQPERWFWFHRRWRTRPEEDPKNPYAS